MIELIVAMLLPFLKMLAKKSPDKALKVLKDLEPIIDEAQKVIDEAQKVVDEEIKDRDVK